MKNAKTSTPTPEELEKYFTELKTFIGAVQLYECRRTMLYLYSFYRLFRNHHPVDYLVIETMEEFEILLIFLDNLQRIQGYPESAIGG